MASNERTGRSRVAPADAWYLFADELHTDQLLIYGFTGVPPSVEQAVEDVVARARACSELRLRVDHRDSSMSFPNWLPGDVDTDQIVVHNSEELDWSGCLRASAELVDQHQLDPEKALWRLHVFTTVYGVPASARQPSTVAIVQISHALADGIRSAALAGVLFGRTAALPPITSPPVRPRVVRGVEAVRTRMQLIRDTAAGRVPPPPGPVPALSTNNPATGAPVLRTFVRHRTQLPGKSVTIGALIAISEALSGYLGDRGEDASALTALVPMAKPGSPHARNHSGPEFIRLHPEVTPRDERARLIAAEFEDCRRRRQHPAFASEELALAALPGPFLRWVESREKPPTLMGHTVVSSVHRGAADLSFGGCPVVMTAGYPFLTPTIGLTHGVHGIGDMVAISISTTESIISDIDDYLDRLTFSLKPRP